MNSDSAVIWKSFCPARQRNLPETIAIAVGTKAKTYRSVWKSYDSAIKALEYQFAFGNGEILDYDKIQEYVSRQDTQFHP